MLVVRCNRNMLDTLLIIIIIIIQFKAVECGLYVLWCFVWRVYFSKFHCLVLFAWVYINWSLAWCWYVLTKVKTLPLEGRLVIIMNLVNFLLFLMNYLFPKTNSNSHELYFILICPSTAISIQYCCFPVVVLWLFNCGPIIESLMNEFINKHL